MVGLGGVVVTTMVKRELEDCEIGRQGDRGTLGCTMVTIKGRRRGRHRCQWKRRIEAKRKETDEGRVKSERRK